MYLVNGRRDSFSAAHMCKNIFCFHSAFYTKAGVILYRYQSRSESLPTAVIFPYRYFSGVSSVKDGAVLFLVVGFDV